LLDLENFPRVYSAIGLFTRGDAASLCLRQQSTAMKDSELDQLLKNCDPGLKMPPGFRREVWLRIETSQANAWVPAIRRLFTRVLESFALPPVAAATCAAAVLAGVLLGVMPGKSNVSDDSAYLQSISPFVQSTRR
jgi:hypothetical protein